VRSPARLGGEGRGDADKQASKVRVSTSAALCVAAKRWLSSKMPLFSCNPTEKSLYIHDGNAMPLVLQELNLSKCMYICKKNVYKKQIVILVLNICVDYGMHNIFLTYMHTQCKKKKKINFSSEHCGNRAHGS
jgi:hypothetical protein